MTFLDYYRYLTEFWQESVVLSKFYRYGLKLSLHDNFSKGDQDVQPEETFIAFSETIVPLPLRLPPGQEQ